MRAIRSLLSLAAAVLVAGILGGIRAAEWHVAVDGTAQGEGTAQHPWDLASACSGRQPIKPGDFVLLHGGTYRHPDRSNAAMGYEVLLAGTAEQPVLVRNVEEERVTIDGGLTIRDPATHLWLQGLEIVVSENFTRSRRIEETGSHPKSYQRPWGGLNVYGGQGCKFIHLSIHDNAQGVSWWTGSTDSELYGCVIYNNGWVAPDRGHGHAIYTQNRDGVKTIADCILTGGYGYTVHAYGSSRAFVDNYLLTHNVCYDGGQFLVGGGRPSRHIRVLTNWLYRVDMRLGYSAPENGDCEVRGNVILRGGLTINKFKEVVEEDNRVYRAKETVPGETMTLFRPSRYDSSRAHLAVLNGKGLSEVDVDTSGWLKAGEGYGLYNPTNEWGAAVLTGKAKEEGIVVPLQGEFTVFVVRRGHAGPAVIQSGGCGGNPGGTP